MLIRLLFFTLCSLYLLTYTYAQDCAEWAKVISGPNIEVITEDLVLDDEENIYVLGRIWETDFYDSVGTRVDFDIWENSEFWVELDTSLNFNPQMLDNPGFEFVFVAKYDSCANLQWVNTFPGYSVDYYPESYKFYSKNGMKNMDENLYVYLNLADTFLYQEEQAELSDLEINNFLIKFDLNGQFIWSKSFEHEVDFIISDIEVLLDNIVLSFDHRSFNSRKIKLFSIDSENETNWLTKIDWMSLGFNVDGYYKTRISVFNDLVFLPIHSSGDFTYSINGDTTYFPETVPFFYRNDILDIDTNGAIKDCFNLALPSYGTPHVYGVEGLANQGKLVCLYSDIVDQNNCLFDNSFYDDMYVFLDSANCAQIIHSDAGYVETGENFELIRINELDRFLRFGSQWSNMIEIDTSDYTNYRIGSVTTLNTILGVDIAENREYFVYNAWAFTQDNGNTSHPFYDIYHFSPGGNLNYWPIFKAEHKNPDCIRSNSDFENCEFYGVVFKVQRCSNSNEFLLITACQSYETPSGQMLFESGIYEDIIPNQEGCDSIITINLTIEEEEYFERFNAYFCESYTSPSGNTYYESGQILDTVLVEDGCDSIFDINMVLVEYSVEVSQDEIILTALQDSVEYQWIDCDNDFSIIEGETSAEFIPEMNGNYAVIIDPNGCSDTSECYNVMLTGIDNIVRLPVRIFPNPSDGRFLVDLLHVQETTITNIYDSNGKVLEHRRSRGLEIVAFDLNFPSGIYFVEITSENGSKRSVEKILIQ